MDTSTPAQPRPGVTRDVLELAIRRFAGPAAALLSARPLAGDRGDAELKHVGYGEPLLIRYRTAEGEREAVFRTMMPNWFGHDRRADRAALAILAADTYGRMPRHVQVLDVGALGGPEGAVSLGGAGELYLITTYAAGSLYAQDLAAIEARSSATLLDAARQHALCQYLVELHTPFDSWGSGSPGGALRPKPPPAGWRARSRWRIAYPLAAHNCRGGPDPDPLAAAVRAARDHLEPVAHVECWVGAEGGLCLPGRQTENQLDGVIHGAH